MNSVQILNHQSNGTGGYSPSSFGVYGNHRCVGSSTGVGYPSPSAGVCNNGSLGAASAAVQAAVHAALGSVSNCSGPPPNSGSSISSGFGRTQSFAIHDLLGLASGSCCQWKRISTTLSKSEICGLWGVWGISTLSPLPIIVQLQLWEHPDAQHIDDPRYGLQRPTDRDGVHVRPIFLAALGCNGWSHDRVHARLSDGGHWLPAG